MAFEEVKSEEERKNLLTRAQASSKPEGSLPGADNEYVGAVTALKASMVLTSWSWNDPSDREEVWECS